MFSFEIATSASIFCSSPSKQRIISSGRTAVSRALPEAVVTGIIRIFEAISEGIDTWPRRNRRGKAFIAFFRSMIITALPPIGSRRRLPESDNPENSPCLPPMVTFSVPCLAFAVRDSSLLPSSVAAPLASAPIAKTQRERSFLSVSCVSGF